VNRASDPDPAVRAELAGIAGSHLTHIARRFAHHRKAAIAIEELVDGKWIFRPLDLRRESLPPFDWRLHLRVTPVEDPASTASTEDAAWERLRAGFETVLQGLMDNAQALQQLLTPEPQQQPPLPPVFVTMNRGKPAVQRQRKKAKKKKTVRSKARRRTS
jgi:hypothetical protein